MSPRWSAILDEKLGLPAIGTAHPRAPSLPPVAKSHRLLMGRIIR